MIVISNRVLQEWTFFVILSSEELLVVPELPSSFRRQQVVSLPRRVKFLPDLSCVPSERTGYVATPLKRDFLKILVRIYEWHLISTGTLSSLLSPLFVTKLGRVLLLVKLKWLPGGKPAPYRDMGVSMRHRSIGVDIARLKSWEPWEENEVIFLLLGENNRSPVTSRNVANISI